MPKKIGVPVSLQRTGNNPDSTSFRVTFRTPKREVIANSYMLSAEDYPVLQEISRLMNELWELSAISRYES